MFPDLNSAKFILKTLTQVGLSAMCLYIETPVKYEEPFMKIVIGFCGWNNIKCGGNFKTDKIMMLMNSLKPRYNSPQLSDFLYNPVYCSC